MSNQIQNTNAKMFSKTISYLSVNTQVVRFTVHRHLWPPKLPVWSKKWRWPCGVTYESSGLFQFSSVNLEPWTMELWTFERLHIFRHL